MRKKLELENRRFGRLVALKRNDTVSKTGKSISSWDCLCDCGNRKIILQYSLVSGNTKSCGCLSKEKAKEHCSKLNFVEDVEKYIRDRIIVNKENNCWEWTGSISTKGYPQSGLSRYSKVASRTSYMVFIGKIPKGILVCHKCDNPKCVNPDHLFLGTQQDNMNDMVEKGRSLRGEKHPKTKLNESDVRRIRKSRYKPCILARKYKVSQSAIRHIQDRRTWKHVQ